MKIGIFTTVHICDRRTLGCLRVLVDSVRANVRRDEYECFVIVDDCSPDEPQLQAYYDWLVSSGTAEVYRLGEPRRPCTAARIVPAGTQLSNGHAMGLMAGFWYLRERGCTHAWIIDGDCAVLRPGIIEGLRPLAAIDGVAVVTDFFGGRPSEHTQVVDAQYLYTLGPDGQEIRREDKSRFPIHAAWVLYGFPNLFCALVDLTKEEDYGFLFNAGWVNGRWGYRLFRRGAKVAYYPFFQNGSVYHLGFGFTKYNAQLVEQSFGNTVEVGKYGGKSVGIYHAGYLQLARSTDEHARWLDAAANGPYEALVQMERSWLVEPPQMPAGGRAGGYIRNIVPSDFDALRVIETDPEVIRFMQWGPNDEAATRAFIARAQSEMWRWFAWADDTTDKLIGFGEIQPVADHEGRRTCGLTYVIGRSHWGKGHGAHLLNVLIEAAYNQLDYYGFTVRIDTEHAASIRVLKATADQGRLWEHAGVEDYVLRGRPRKRHVYQMFHTFAPGPPAATAEQRHRDREELLFENLKMRRPVLR